MQSRHDGLVSVLNELRRVIPMVQLQLRLDDGRHTTTITLPNASKLTLPADDIEKSDPRSRLEAIPDVAKGTTGL